MIENLITYHWKTETISDCNPKQARLQQTILTVLFRRHGSDKRTCVRARDTEQALPLSLSGAKSTRYLCICSSKSYDASA